MKYRSGHEVRQLFLDYFSSKKHMIEPGAPLVPHDDPTLLWINSGVAALKKYFDGRIKPSNPRITNAQKSIRTNDIENVGKTARHHTFFEMLGNFSIGDYFKEDAIRYAWEFLTSKDYIGMEAERMYITVHPSDHEAYRLWTEVIGVNPQHILKSEDNYWQIGEGPCGPNSELYYDRGPAYDPQGIGERLFFEELENDRYIEVWNIVFSQYEGKEGVERDQFKELPQKNIDTGMGLERLVAIVQGVETNFDSDLFMPIIHALEKQAKHPYHAEYKMAYRVIADHIRTVSFALSDGALFSNEGRGYVLRRILRRALRFGLKLEIDGAFMYQLVQVVADMNEPYYPYLQTHVDLVQRLVKAEELRFHKTLNAGEQLLSIELSKANDRTLSGQTVFKLYDTFGFPVELTQEIAEEQGYQIDMDGFKAEMNQQKARARAALEKTESMQAQSIDLMNFTQISKFTGYQETSGTGKVIGLFKDGMRVDSIDDFGEVILDESPFYAESGGQIADTGRFVFDQGEADVMDVQKAPNKQTLHRVQVKYGVLTLNTSVQTQVDDLRREKIMANHTAAHLLQSALREVLGTHVQQAGSYVADDYARFDFTHFEKVQDDDLKRLEAKVNHLIMKKADVQTEILPIEEAKAQGAIALFSEKYENQVRVVTMGNFSKELCGGTHVSNTQALGVFKIVSEESIGSGIRRIVWRTGEAAYQEFIAFQHQLEKIAQLLKSNSIHHIENRVELALEEAQALRHTLASAHQKLAELEAKRLIEQIKSNGSFDYLIERVDQSAEHLNLIVEKVKRMMPDALVFLASSQQNKALFVAYVGPKAQSLGFKAGALVQEAAALCLGKGGGRPDFAQAGGKDASKLNEALNLIRTKLDNSLN